MMHLLRLLNGEQSVALVFDCGGTGYNAVAAQLCMLIARLGLATSVTVLFFWNNHGKMLCDGAFGAIQSRLRKRQIASPSDVMAAADEMKNNAQDGPRGDTTGVCPPQ